MNISKIYRTITNKQNEKIIMIILLLLFVIINTIFIINHECWRDESQPWGIAIFTSWKELFLQLRAEGCPILWFLILKLLYFFGLKFSYIGYVSLMFVTIALYILFFKTNLKFITKIAWCFSCIFLYYNPVICRNYSLVLLVIIVTILLYDNRLKNTIIYSLFVAVLFQTNVFVLGIAISLTIEIIYNSFNNKSNKLFFTGLIPIFSGFVCIIELIRLPGIKTYINWDLGYVINNFKNIKKIIKLIMFSFNSLFDYSFIISLLLIVIIAILLICLLFYLIKEKRYIGLIILIVSNFCTFFMFIIIKQGGGPINNIICCFFIFISSLYFIIKDIDSKRLRTIIILVITILPILTIKKTLKDAFLDYKYDYSQSKNIANFVKHELPQNSIILYDVLPQTSSILSYIQDYRPDIKNMDIVNKKEIYFHSWMEFYQNEYKENSINEFIEELRANNKNIYYIESKERIKIDDLRIIYTSNDYTIVDDEIFKLYRIN